MEAPRAFDLSKFVKTKFSSLDGKTTVAFSENDSDFQIIVSQTGMKFKGNLSAEITSERELQAWAKLISDAWTEHRRLAPKIARTLSGH